MPSPRDREMARQILPSSWEVTDKHGTIVTADVRNFIASALAQRAGEAREACVHEAKTYLNQFTGGVSFTRKQTVDSIIQSIRRMPL